VTDDRHRRATMRDVAALAGVSLKTVSRVVNDEPNVTDATRAQVQRAIDALRYLPDATAANLAHAGRATHTIALLLSAVDNPFAACILRGVEAAARERHVAVFAASTEELPDVEETLVKAFASRNVDGFLITPTACDHRRIAELLGTRWPVVYLDRVPSGITADTITSNNVASATAATQHLIDAGHRRIGLLTDRLSIGTARDRRQGYEDALRQAGLELDETLIQTDVATVDDAVCAGRRLFAADNPPTAVFASRNAATIGMVRVLKQLGLSHQVGLISIDDIELSDLLDPPLTVVSQDPEGMGRLAAQRLFARLDGDDTPPVHLIIPTTLLARGSGEIPCRVTSRGQIRATIHQNTPQETPA